MSDDPSDGSAAEGVSDREVSAAPATDAMHVGPTAPPWNTMDRVRTRSGRGVLERKALYAVQRELEALPASILVQLLLWPETISAWAESAGVRSSQAYNTLAGVKWYHDVRQKLADRLGVSKPDLDYLIDARRPLPTSQRRPMPADDWSPPGDPSSSASPRGSLPDPPPAASGPAPDQGQLPL
jgi:hypothetical protein